MPITSGFPNQVGAYITNSMTTFGQKTMFEVKLKTTIKLPVGTNSKDRW